MRLAEEKHPYADSFLSTRASGSVGGSGLPVSADYVWEKALVLSTQRSGSATSDEAKNPYPGTPPQHLRRVRRFDTRLFHEAYDGRRCAWKADAALVVTLCGSTLRPWFHVPGTRRARLADTWVFRALKSLHRSAARRRQQKDFERSWRDEEEVLDRVHLGR
jgi:hypothetical protein